MTKAESIYRCPPCGTEDRMDSLYGAQKLDVFGKTYCVGTKMTTCCCFAKGIKI
jgi:hypothetical protein